MFGLSGTELILILVFALLLFGPKKLPELARTLGKGVRDFKRATDDIRSSVETEFYRMDQVKPPEAPAQAEPGPALPSAEAAQATPVAASEAKPAGDGPAEGEPRGGSGERPAG